MISYDPLSENKGYKLFDSELKQYRKYLTEKQIEKKYKIIDHISADEDLKNMWKKYQKKFSYANDISYEQVIALLREVVLEE